MILPEELQRIEPQHFRDVAIVVGDVADADRGVDDDRPHRGDEDHEDRRGLTVAERGERDGKPGERGNGAQHLEHRIESAHRPDGLSDHRADRDADDRGKPEADRDALQRHQQPPAQARFLRAVDEERIDDELARTRPRSASARAGSRPAPSQSALPQRRARTRERPAEELSAPRRRGHSDEPSRDLNGRARRVAAQELLLPAA